MLSKVYPKQMALKLLSAIGRRTLVTSKVFQLSLSPMYNENWRPNDVNVFDAVEPLNAIQLRDRYDRTKKWLHEKRLPTDVDKLGVFANDEVNLGQIDVYGFDYDYTLATYKESVEHLIHDIAKNILVDELKVIQPWKII